VFAAADHPVSARRGLIVYTGKQNENGLRSVSYMGITFADGLYLGPAVTQARDGHGSWHAI